MSSRRQTTRIVKTPDRDGASTAREVVADQEPFESKVIRRYQRRSDTIDEAFMNLFVEGLPT